MNLKAVVLLLAAFLFYQGYTKKVPPTPPTPDIDTIEYVELEETFPDAPTEPTVIAALNKLDSVGVSYEDALILARAYKQWAKGIATSPKIENLSQLAVVHKEAAEQLLAIENQVAGKYGGKVNAVIKEVYTIKLDFLKGPDGVQSTKIDANVRNALVGWANAISWKMNEIFETKTKELVNAT